MKFIGFVFILNLLVNYTYGQNELIQTKDITLLSEKERKDFIEYIRALLDDLERYITMIADTQDIDQRRKDAIQEAIKLFIEPNKNFVEVSSKISNTIDSVLVRRYFYKLYAIEAAKVEITFYDIAHLDSLKKGIDGKYYGTAYLYQMTKIYKDNEKTFDPTYQDKTVKKIDIILEPDNYWLKNINGPKYILKLGDIKVVQTI